MITYTCRYSSGHLIPIIQSCQDELRIKCQLAGVGDHPCLLTCYNYISTVKLLIFPYACTPKARGYTYMLVKF